MEDALDALSRVISGRRAELARVARKEGLGAEDAVDCVQDALCTLLGIVQRGELPADRDALPGFLAGIVRNAARNERRLHRNAKPHDDLDAVPPADDVSAEALVARAERHVRLRACVDRLCETQKAVVTLRLLEERAGEDVASALGITRGHVDVLLHRAKASLRVCLTDDD
jgi:RNA polymerase sigma-70 factor (ECF subfamily)